MGPYPHPLVVLYVLYSKMQSINHDIFENGFEETFFCKSYCGYRVTGYRRLDDIVITTYIVCRIR